MANKYKQFSKVNSKKNKEKENKEWNRLMRSCLCKREYATEELARERARINGKKHNMNYRVYKCKVCGNYHLTTKPFNPIKQRG